MPPALVIFDCDGVLVDSEILSAEVEAEALTAIGLPMTAREAMRAFLGMTQADMEARIERDHGMRVPPDHASTTQAMLREAYKTRLKPIAGVAALIDTLKAAGVPVCVASNSPPAKMGLGLSLTGLFEPLYPHVFCSRLVARGKPAPDLFLYAARQLGAQPADTVVVEDSQAGIRAAVAAGMTAVGFVGGLHHEAASIEGLRGVGAHHIAASMDEVRALLGV